MTAFAKYTLSIAARTTFILGAVAGLVVSGCFEPDLRSVRGALDAAARAIEDGDGRALFQSIDERARHAMISTVRTRQRAAGLIRADYPPREREAALAGLGDAALARDAPELFARRCATECMAQLAAQLGAPSAQTARGVELEVRTVRGGRLRMFRGGRGTWGIVFRTDELSAERARASRELRQIEKNAEIYRRRRALEASR